MKRIRPLLAMALALALICLGGSFAFADDEGNGRSVTDPSTMNDWQAVVGSDTSNIGRIWTDKTVSADKITTSSGDVVGRDKSAFITALSALSSTSNVASTSTTPLDIVLVLDASGSMDGPMGNSDRTKRIDALKNAANDFVSKIAAQNKGISDASKQHQVSIVKFAGNKSAAVGNDTYRGGYGYTYNYSQVMKTMSPCTDADAFKDTINSISPAGSTRADYGLQLADETSKREDAKKIVVFFTDGSPTSSSGFEDGVASSAVASAKAMKGKGATVYTIGIFNGANPSADPSGASNENKFMHAVSSNYPNASYTESSGFWGGWNWDLGTRPEGSDYYKSATNAAELEKVFDDISSEIVKGSGYPTSTTEGAEHQSGYITFDDPLGAYMKVDAFEAIAVAGKTFYNPTKSTEGKVDTYTFAGKVELNGKNVDVGDVKITVTNSGDDLATGDMVKVEVPAALIPLRSFNVDQDKMTMTVSDTQPINVVYTSSLKPEAENLLANPDDAMTQYLQANSKDGKASFYSNDWEQGYLGKTVASFEPSKDNSYYYFTSDTPIYTDEACTQRAHQVVKGNTYWYKHSYFEMASGGAAEAKEKPVSFKGDDAEVVEGAIENNDEGAYFKSGTTRLTYLNELYKGKTSNDTGTALDVLNPKWVVAGQVGSYLGNNGKLSVDLPGTLAVTKQLQVPEGYELSDFGNDTFEFTISMTEAANKGFSAVVKNASGEQQGDAFTLQFNNEGKATHSLKAGETLCVYGLDGGWSYEVSEAKRNGFAQEGTGLKGAIAAGQTVNAKVVNTYSASGKLEGQKGLAGEKILTGRAWLSTDKFTFVLKPAEGSVDVPMPEGTSQGMARVEVTQPEGTPDGTKVPFNFGDITYTKPGVYTYEIHESAELSTLNPGVSESEALYEVTVTVTDKNHTGKLSVESEMKQLLTDDGNKVEQPATSASFVNEFNKSEAKWAPIGAKEYTDSTGMRPLEQGMFHVIACTNDPGAPLPKLDGDQEINAVRDGVNWRGAVVSVDANGTITFPQATYTYGNLDLGQTEKTFTYKIMEVVKDGNNWRSVEDALKDPKFDSAGVTYDPTIWTVKVTLKDDNGVLVLSAQYLKNGVPVQGASFQFANSYDPTPATAAIEGSKTLAGRDMAANETFGFELSAADDATQRAVDAGTVTLPGAATVSGAKDGVSAGFAFDEMSFTKPGEYTFNMNETLWNGAPVPATDGNGMQFDRSTQTVKVTVTDDHTGSLKAEVTYPNGAAFANKYATSSNYNGIQVEKTLQGRNMAAGEFGFTIEGKNDESTALLTDTDKQFTNENNRAAGVADVMTKLSGHTFTQSDNGKHFEFAVKEVIPGGAVQDQATGLWYVGATGLYYDGANHVVTIDVADDGNGQLTVTTKVDGQVGNVVAFVNKYRAQDVSFDTANAELNKILQGRDWIENDSFDFTIKALDDDAPMPMRDGSEVSSVTLKSPNSKDGEPVPFNFGQITFTSDMVKDAPGHTRTFTYEVTETAGNLPGIQYSTNKATIQITVSDNGKGQLVASATTQNGSFENRYSAELNYTAAGGLNLAKTLTGRDMTDGQFSIKITPVDQAAAEVLGLPNDGAVISMPAANDGEQVVKSALSSQAVFDQGDAGETYVYTVVEQGTAPNGYTYDTAERTVTITVEGDATQGTLKATTVVSGGPDGDKTFVYESSDPAPQAAVVPFANSYTASGEVGISATKSLSGRDLTDGEFSFALKYAKGSEDVATATNDANGNVNFGAIKYTTEGLAKLVTDGHAAKTVKDDKPAWNVDYVAYEKTDSLPAGVSAQTQRIPFTVTVVDNGDGTLAATANTGNGLEFKNAYSTGDPIEVGLSGIKILNAGKGLTPASIEGKFTFTVTSDDAAAPMPQKTTATNDANGNVDFGSIKFSLDDLNKASGATNTRATDTDNSAASKVDAQGSQGAEGQNSAADSDAAGQADTEQGNAADSGNGAEGQGAVMAADDGQGAASAKTVANDADAADDGSDQAQGSEPSTRAGVSRSHIFTYKVTESGSAAGVTNDANATKTVSFKVTYGSNGKLTVNRVEPDGDSKLAFTFTNTYSVQPTDSSVTDQVKVTKQLTGRDMAAGEFAFELLEGNDVVASGTNGADGSVALSKITYTKPGTHSYTLREVGGGTHKAGVEYDGSVFAVTTTVTDNGDGTLSVAHKVDNDANAVAFTNTYAPAATSVTLGASKVLDGKSLEDGEFSFALEGEDSTQLVAKNDANGMVAFPAIQYSKAGTYQYTLSEVKGTESGVTYDEATYAVAVAVEYDREGSLVATVSYKGGKAPVFNNTYQEPEGPAAADDPVSFVKAAVSGAAKTGDNLLGIAVAIAAVAAAAAAVAALSLRKKGKHAKK